MASLSKYACFLASAFKSQLIYRSSTLLQVLMEGLSLLIQVSLWTALIGSGARGDVTLPAMMAYVCINRVVSTLTDSGLANELGASIRDGSVVMHFIRPASFQLSMLSTMIGQNLYSLCTVILPLVALGGLLIGVPLPSSAPYAVLFFVHLLLGILIVFELTFLVSLLAFWTQATWFLSWYLRAGITFFGGTMVPLWFYPQLLNTLSRFLPFRYITFEAINAYLGRASITESLQALGIAVGWFCLLLLLGQLLWRLVQRKMTINGG